MELLALGSCLPGPTSTQVSFALGMMQQGWTGGLLSGDDITLFPWAIDPRSTKGLRAGAGFPASVFGSSSVRLRPAML